MRHSPHYTFHGTLSQAAQFKEYYEMCGITGEDRKAVAREILSRWQKSGNDWDAGQYLNHLEAEFISNREHRQP
jgi:hypothetical protein